LNEDYEKLEGAEYNLVNETGFYTTRSSSNCKVVTDEPFAPLPLFAFSTANDQFLNENSEAEVQWSNTSPKILEVKKDSKSSQKMFEGRSTSKVNNAKVEPSTEPKGSS
jgi:hypothetical protein